METEQVKFYETGGSSPPIPAGLPTANAALPEAYTAAKTALANCASIDECKQWSDKMQALASYARQADDDTLLKMVGRIQGRAVRRVGELLKHFQTTASGGRPKNGGGAPTVSQRQAASEAGLSKDQEVQAVRVANVPEEEFEEAIESDDPPTVTELAKRGKKSKRKPPEPEPENILPFDPPEGFAEASKLLGTIKRFAEFCEKHEPEFIANGLMPTETIEVRQTVSVIDSWLDRLVVNLKEPDSELSRTA